MLKIPSYKYILALCDYVILLLALAVAVWLRFPGQSIASIYMSERFPVSVCITVLIYCVAWLGIVQSFSLYKISTFLSIVEQTVSLFKSVSYGVIGLILISFVTKDAGIIGSRLTIGYFTIISFLMLVVFRVMVFRMVFLFLSKHAIGLRNIVVVGAGKRATHLAKELIATSRYGVDVIGFVDDNISENTEVLPSRRVLGKINKIEQIASAHQVDEIIIALSNVSYQRLHDIIDECKKTGLPIKLSSKLYEIVPSKVKTEVYGTNGVIDISPRFDEIHMIYKRLIDLVLSAVAIGLASPLLLAVAVMIKWDSIGPVFYRQKRVGRNGKLFWCFKFRSMYIDAESRKKELAAFNEATGPIFKMKNDPRVTKVGKIIRALSIDELPQLINVFLGDMSLVGPRPCTPDELEKYEHWHTRRLAVPQGITGLWQVSGRSNLSFKEMVVLDIYYIENMSIVMDVSILLKTIPAVLLRRGAY
jgi:exopolysaccharide biosynthesis polyprenyl glycosylphosphotransferase